MDKYPQIEISEEAILNLNALLKEHSEYNCVRFTCGSSCCNKPKLDIMLDEISSSDICQEYKDIKIVYSRELEDTIESINLIYKDSTFMLKFEPVDKSLTASNEGCLTCNKKNSNCHSCSH